MRRILVVKDDKYLRKQIYWALKDIILPQRLPSDLGKEKKKRRTSSLLIFPCMSWRKY